MNASMRQKKLKNKGEQPEKKIAKSTKSKKPRNQTPNSRKKKDIQERSTKHECSLSTKVNNHIITPWVEEGSKEKVKNRGNKNEEVTK